MTTTTEGLTQPIEARLQILQRRSAKMTRLSLGALTLSVVAFILLFFQKDMIYSYLGLTQQVEQLHLPFSVDLSHAYLDTNYFFNLMLWIGWLILKVIVAFVGAFFIVSLLKKIRFFYTRLQGFSLKIVAWLIAFILLWAGLSYIQYGLKSDEQVAAAKLVYYDQNIQSSKIFQYLQQRPVAPAVQDYVLAQTALLHQPVNREVATAYVAKLIQAERTDAYFYEYGFKPEQIWSMQQQIYSKAVTPMAQRVEPKALKANQWLLMTQYIYVGIILMSFVFSIMTYLISLRLKNRLIRIAQHLQ